MRVARRQKKPGLAARLPSPSLKGDSDDSAAYGVPEDRYSWPAEPVAKSPSPSSSFVPRPLIASARQLLVVLAGVASWVNEAPPLVDSSAWPGAPPVTVGAYSEAP